MPTYVAVFALVLAYVALVAAYVALRTLAKLRRSTALLTRAQRGANGTSTDSLLELTQRHAERTELVAEEVRQLRAELGTAVERASAQAAGAAQAAHTLQEAAGRAPEPAPGGLRNIALVRYDAFSEMSGRMSFSLALLNEKGDGVTISAIAGTGDTRVYAKGVAAGKGEHELSPEEQQAVHAALAKRRGLLHRKSA